MVARSLHRSTHSLSHYSASLSRYTPRSGEFKAIKYTLIVFMILLVVSSIWVGFFTTWQRDWEYRWARDDPSARAAVNSWYINALFWVIFADLVDLVLMMGVWGDKRSWVMATALLALIFSMYGICSVYLRGSITCFVIPFTISTLSVIMLYMIRHEEAQYDVARGPGLRTAVKRF